MQYPLYLLHICHLTEQQQKQVSMNWKCHHHSLHTDQPTAPRRRDTDA